MHSRKSVKSKPHTILELVGKPPPGKLSPESNEEQFDLMRSSGNYKTEINRGAKISSVINVPLIKKRSGYSFGKKKYK